MRKNGFHIVLRVAAITISVFIFMSSCHKKALEDTGYANEHATAEQTFNDVQTISDQAATLPSGSAMGYKTTSGGCATVTHKGDSTIVDFGATDCSCHDGRTRRGKIIMVNTGHYGTAGSVRTITFDNFYQNDNKVTGTKTITSMGANAQGQPWYMVHVSGCVTLNGGGTVSAEWNRVRTWTAGYNTPNDLTDDVYVLTGSGTITSASGRVIRINITVPLVCAYNCHWVEAGSVAFSVASGESRTLNYGDTPVCDNLATITLGNGTVRNITLP